MTDWPPTAGQRARLARARLYSNIRAFFQQRDVLEVETPLLGRHGVTDPHIDCIAADGGFLQPSPEYHMKRLLAAGAGPIYQITRAFRAGEQGQRHNPEFAMLEWYRPGFSLTGLIDECLTLFQSVLGQPPARVLRYRDAFQTCLGVDPLTDSDAALHACAERLTPSLPELDRQGVLDWLLATAVEPALAKDELVVLHDFPPAAAALAEVAPDEQGEPVARRFEIFFAGRELANGYQELTDAAEQAERFNTDLARRAHRGVSQPAPDPRLLAALNAGLPQCAGVAVGLDRLLMCQLETDDISDVLNFPAGRA